MRDAGIGAQAFKFDAEFTPLGPVPALGSIVGLCKDPFQSSKPVLRTQRSTLLSSMMTSCFEQRTQSRGLFACHHTCCAASASRLEQTCRRARRNGQICCTVLSRLCGGWRNGSTEFAGTSLPGKRHNTCSTQWRHASASIAYSTPSSRVRRRCDAMREKDRAEPLAVAISSSWHTECSVFQEPRAGQSSHVAASYLMIIMNISNDESWRILGNQT